MEDYERIVTMLNRAQVDVSNDMTELSILIQKTVLQIASGKVYEGTQWAPDHTHFDLQDLLPEGFLPRDTSVNTLINVAPIPLHLPDELKKYTKQKAVATPESNVAHLLSINHLQLLHARELGNGKQLGKEHTIWENCIRNIQDLAPPREPDDPTPPVKAPEGLSRTVSGAIVELTTAVGNIWNGAAYRKLLDYLVRILLRIHLAPNREKNSQKKGSIVKVKDQKPDNSSSEQKPDDSNSEQKPGQETTSEKKPKIRDLTRKHWLYKFKGLCNTLSDELERVDDDRFERKSGQIMMLLSTLEGQRTTGQQHHLARLDVRLKELTGSSHARTADPDDEKVDQGDIDKTLGKVAGGLKTNEPSDSQLTALGSILKKLLESPDGLDCGKEWIQQQSFQGTKFTDAECDIVLKLGKLLWPYVPPKGSIPHVCLRAPLAFIANSFLRMTGYKKFTRELSPTISASAVHALGLNAAGLYETLCAGSKNHYDVKDASGHPLTDASKVTTPAENKRAVFEAFFDMTAVDKLCDTYGLRFHNR
ncbi:MAG: hypothetical protein J3Q66DRAFT_99014 [Benniella sp.]|nr:MAG: hypothetical protein J3Q66DRAFT_99014 [Benniella sp.]